MQNERSLNRLTALGLACTLGVALLGVTPWALAQVTVSLTAPFNGATFTPGANITLSATATAPSGYTLSKVEFFQGSTLIGTDTSSPYSITWNNVPQGNYTLTAKATAIKKNQPDQMATSSPRNIIVTVPPVVTLHSPTEGAHFPSTPALVSLSASASDSDGTIERVVFRYEDTTEGCDVGTLSVSAPPYEGTFEINPNRVCETGNFYFISATAFDNQGSSSSQVVTISIVENAAPTVNLTSPANNATFTAPANITLTATATDPDSTIQKVEFFHGGTNLIATVTTAPYTFNWTNVAAGSYSLTARATDSSLATTTSAAVSVTVTTGVAQLYFIHTDHLNTPRLVANQSGQTVWRWDQQEPFGVNVPDENPSALGAFEFPLRFPGQYADKETNLHYNYFRDYDPSIGRYAESDPIGLKGGLNTYSYVRGDPLRRRDSTGLNPDDPPKAECRPTPCIKNCLDKIMGQDVTNVVVISDQTMAFPYAITYINSITTKDSCTGFFGIPEIVLEEYYHVLQQWNTGRLTTYRYLRDNAKAGGYDKNPWEVEAKSFAANNLEAFKKCINCCK